MIYHKGYERYEQMWYGTAMTRLAVILDNIRSAENVGAIFRTAEGAGVSKIFLCGYTPAPIDRFGRSRRDIAKAALGAEEVMVWEQYPDALAAIKAARSEEYRVVAVEQASGAQMYYTYQPEKDTAYIFGNEVDGIEEAVLRASDAVIEIPMRGKKESLNVSVAAGVVLFRAREAC